MPGPPRFLLVLTATAACSSASAPPVPWLYDANLALGPRPPAGGSFGRGVRPLSLMPAGIVAAPGVTGGPAAIEVLIPAEDGAAEAVAFGGTAGALVIELVDIDAGVVRWRNQTTALSPLHFAADTIIAGDDSRTAGIDRGGGGERWRHDAAFRARDGNLVAMAASDGVVLADARDGTAAVALTPPGGHPPGAIVAVCAAAAPYLFAHRDGRLMRWEPDGLALREVWSVAAGTPVRIDACGATVVVLGGEPRAAIALDPATGAVVGGPVAARDLWPARHGDGLELATASGIEARDRRLGGARALEPARVGRLLARRGSRRLVARGDGGLVLLDDHGARALAEPFGAARAALGDRFLVGGTWALPARTLASRLTRYLLPPASATAAPMPPLGEMLVGDPPRLDLPASLPLPAGVALDSAGAWSVGSALVDASDPARIFVHVAEQRPSDTLGVGVAAFDLRSNTWVWHGPTACPPGMPVALAATSRIVVCGARRVTPGTGAVRAVDRDDGRTLWEWRGVTVDAVIAASRIATTRTILPGTADAADVVLVFEGARVVALDPATGRERTTWRASDGWLPRVAVVRRDRDVIVASLEHGHVVLRSAIYGLRPLVSVEVRGVVAGMFTVGDRVAVTLTDGTAYLIDERGAATAAAGLSPSWDAAGDLLTVTTTDATGADGVVVAYGNDGVARIAATLPGSGGLGVAPRTAVPGAPVAVVGGAAASRITVLTTSGRAALAADLPPDAPRTPVVSTAVDGSGVVAAVLARPLRLVRLDVQE